jgi:hypothetical protein
MSKNERWCPDNVDYSIIINGEELLILSKEVSSNLAFDYDVKNIKETCLDMEQEPLNLIIALTSCNYWL